jgi:hypothetical protein
MQPQNKQSDEIWDSPGRLIPAVVLIGIGVLFLLSNLRIIPDWNWWSFWPAILVVVGILKLVEHPDRPVGGAVLVVVGGALLADALGYLPVPVFDLWPLILIAIGLALFFDRLNWRGPFEGLRSRTGGGPFHGTAMFGGGKRKLGGEDFKGGAFSALFGGFEIDLRNAYMAADSAVLQVDAVFGGIEIKAPPAWSVEMHGSGLFGGFSDETNHPAVVTPETKRLIVKGSAVFGGVVVKN